MSWLDNVRAKYAYNEWANEKVYTASAALSDQQLTAERIGTSYGTLARDLTHIASVQHRWSTIISESEIPDRAQPPETGITPFLRELLDASNVVLRKMVDSLTDESLEATIQLEREGETYSWVRWHLVEHIANHSAHHRAEIGQVLHTLGASQGDMDFVDFIDPD